MPVSDGSGTKWKHLDNNFQIYNVFLDRPTWVIEGSAKGSLTKAPMCAYTIVSSSEYPPLCRGGEGNKGCIPMYNDGKPYEGWRTPNGSRWNPLPVMRYVTF